jgi:acyl phosphate:glycerol-3-phosphate acyltransferase
MLELSIKTLLAYLLGALMGGLLLGYWRGVDIRTQGSGNAGGTNAIRTQGVAFGLAVLAFDVLKGVVAAAWLPLAELPGIPIDPQIPRSALGAVCAGAAVVGHVYPVWFDFRGGKGAATMAGAAGAIAPWLLLPMIGTWIAVLLLSGYVGLATMCAGIAAVGAVIWRAPGDQVLLCFTLAMAMFVIFTHRSNIARMCTGTESRANRLWLLKPRT